MIAILVIFIDFKRFPEIGRKKGDVKMANIGNWGMPEQMQRIAWTNATHPEQIQPAT